jgi:hypothetical protein
MWSTWDLEEANKPKTTLLSQKAMIFCFSRFLEFINFLDPPPNPVVLVHHGSRHSTGECRITGLEVRDLASHLTLFIPFRQVSSWSITRSLRLKCLGLILLLLIALSHFFLTSLCFSFLICR